MRHCLPWSFPAFILLVLNLTAAPARGESYVGCFLGAMRTANSHIPFTLTHQHEGGISFEKLHVPGRVDFQINLAIGGGVRAGTWFVPEGFPGFNYPRWLRFFGCYVDLEIHSLNFRPQPLDTVAVDHTPPVNGTRKIPPKHTNRYFSTGIVITPAFLVAARYGFFPTPEIPYGRLQPYVAVGPGLFVMNQTVTVQTKSYIAEEKRFTRMLDISPGGQTSVSLCLVTDLGLRWMISPRFSVDLFFRYRYAQPSFTYRYQDPLTLKNASFTMRPVFNIFGFHLGLAYHF